MARACGNRGGTNCSGTNCSGMNRDGMNRDGTDCRGTAGYQAAAAALARALGPVRMSGLQAG